MFIKNATIVTLATLFVGAATVANAGVSDVENIADILHPAIHDKVGDGSNANPNGANDAGDDIHGIANVFGKNRDNDPRNDDPGFADQLGTVHGGIGAVNKNAK